MPRCRLSLAILLLGCFLPAVARETDDSWPPNPVPRRVLDDALIERYRFGESPEQDARWRAGGTARLHRAAAGFRLESTGGDPMLIAPPVDFQGPVSVTVRMRTEAAGPLEIFYGSAETPEFSPARAVRRETPADGQWHEVSVPIAVKERITQLRIDPATDRGTIEIEWVEVRRHEQHPLEIAEVWQQEERAEITLVNHGETELRVAIGEDRFIVPPGERVSGDVAMPPQNQAADVWTITATSPGLPPVRRRVFRVVAPDQLRGAVLRDGDVEVRLAEDATAAAIFRHGRRGRPRHVGWLAPLVAVDGRVPPLQSIEDHPTNDAPENGHAKRILLSGPGIESLRLEVADGEIHYAVERAETRGATGRGMTGTLEGPVLRAAGVLEQGLLPGVEHLGRGEASSTTLDLPLPEAIRFRPHPLLVTIPMASLVTDRGALAMLWEDTTLQPFFATPDFLDGRADHRVSLRGDAIRATIRVAGSWEQGERLERAVLWGVRRRGGLPPLPEVEMDLAAIERLLLRGFDDSGIDAGDHRYFHAVLPGLKTLPDQPQPFADLITSRYYLTGQLPDVPLVPGGGHLRGHAAFFLTGQADRWVADQRRKAAGLIARQGEDGSYRYDGPLREGHFENTSSGQCGLAAAELMRYARQTGDEAALEAGLRTLAFMHRFRTPRGASVWECPLHAPDLLASAHAVSAYVDAYLLTGDRGHLDEAVRWALSGVPYVYLWDDRPIMRYATIGTLCATHYEAPVWIGRPVQWMGLVYADALLDLAPHDDSLDWRHLAHGMLLSAVQQTYTEGPSVGLLADSLLLASQKLAPFDINPSALVLLLRRLEQGEEDLYLAELPDGRRLLSPHPVEIEEDAIWLRVPQSRPIGEVVIDGVHVIQPTEEGMVLLDE